MGVFYQFENIFMKILLVNQEASRPSNGRAQRDNMDPIPETITCDVIQYHHRQESREWVRFSYKQKLGFELETTALTKRPDHGIP